MAWSWSHSPEAYNNARQNVFNRDREWLQVVWAEWQATIPHPEHGIGFHAELDLAKYESLMVEAKALSDEALAESIWERAVELGHCTNGGWEAWCCPFGCGCHTVSFDLKGGAGG